jgi:hypothetical protein
MKGSRRSKLFCSTPTLSSSAGLFCLSLALTPSLVSSFAPDWRHHVALRRPPTNPPSSLFEGGFRVDDLRNDRPWLDLKRTQRRKRKDAGLIKQDPKLLQTTKFRMENSAILESSYVKAAIGLTFSVGVIYLLAMLGDSSGPVDVVSDNQLLLDEELSKLTRNVYGAVMPEDANDLVAIALGEGIGAVIGATATAIVTAIVTGFIRVLRMNSVNTQPNVLSLASSEDIVSEAVADTEYFWTRAGLVPLLRSLGVSPAIARLTSVTLATVPYEVVKWQAKKEKERQAEDTLMDELLLAQQQKEQRQLWGGTARPTWVDPLKLESIERRPTIDVPEILSDVIKWLEYDVLKTDFGGQLIMDGKVLGSGPESAVFGFVIALSSQLYLDIIYCYTDYGPSQVTKETRKRSAADWFYLYINRCLGTATLFGVYESVSLPVSIALQGLLAGAVDGCVGSQDFNICLATFMADNPPQASPEAQFRALVIALVSLFDRVQVEGFSGSEEVIRALVVQLYNVAANSLH